MKATGVPPQPRQAVTTTADRQRALLASMLDPHVLLEAVRDGDGEGAIVDFVYADANAAAAEYMQMPAEELIGSRLLDLLPGQAGSGMLQLYADAVESGEPLVLDDYAYPHEILHDERIYDIRGVRVGDALSFTWRDVTDRHQQAADLAASEERCRLLAENASDVVAQSAPDGTITWISTSVTALLGWQPQDLIGRPIFGLLHPDDLPRIAAAQARLARGEPLTVDARVRTADGGYRWLASHVRVLLDSSGQVTSRVAGWRDIQEQHAATEALAESEELFRSAMAHSAAGMGLLAPAGTFIRVNAALGSILGVSLDELMTRRWREFMHADDATTLQALFDDVEHGVRDTFRTASRFRRPDGALVWGDVSVSCVRLPDGGVRYFIVQVIDVTAARRAMARTKEAERRFRLLAENATDVVLTADPDRRITWVSPNVGDTLGWAEADLLGRLVADFVHPEDLQAAAADVQRLYAARGDATTIDLRLRWRTREGYFVWMLGTATRVLAADSSLDYVVVGLSDISQEVTAREFLASVLDSALDPHLMLTPVRADDGQVVDLEYTDVNSAAADYLRTPAEQLVGKRMLEEYGGEATHTILGWCTEALTAGEPFVRDSETLISEVTQDTRWLDVRAVPVNGLVSLTWRDVTERHRATVLLTASEEKFRLLAENSTDAVLHARDGVLVWLSPSLSQVLGWAPEDWVGHEFEEFTHPDDVALAQQRRREINAGNTRITRLRMRDTAGVYHWVELHASPFEGADGAPDGIVASFRTIDEQIQAERALTDRARYDELTGLLNRSEVFARLRALLRREPQLGQATAVAFCDLDGFKEINDTYGHMMGDHVLKTVAQHLRSILRYDDLVARIGGDELLLVLTGVHDLATAEQVLAKVHAHTSQPHDYQGIPYTPRMSIGVTLLRAGEEPDEVIARADRAMYAAKQAGGDRVVSG